MALLEARGLTLQLRDRSAAPLFGAAPLITIFRNMNLALEAGESVGIVGESGSGKTSFARTLLRLYEPTAGSLHFKGRDISHLPEQELRPLRAQIQSIFQDSLSSLNPRHRIGTILAQPLLAYGRVRDRRAGWREASALLERVGLPSAFADRFPHELSGGQRQRVGIARAIALKPDLIVADEIVSGLDVSTQAQILMLLRELKTDGSLIFISHDLSVVRVLCDRVLVMRQGEVIESGRCAELFANPAQAYTRALLDAIPLPDFDPDWAVRGEQDEELQEDQQQEAGKMKIAGSVALVTGANRGIGRCYVKTLVAMGAKKVYAAARDIKGVEDLVKANPGKVEAVKLDVTNEAEVKAAAAKCRDVSLLVNNAGANGSSGALAAGSLDAAHREMTVNYFGVLYLTRAFGPVLKANGGGAIVNMLSVVARVNIPALGTYSASKAAAWSLTQAARAELAKQGTLVVGIFPGAVDTDMAKGMDIPKLDPNDVASIALKAVESGTEDVNVGDMAQGVAAGLKADPKKVEKEFAAYLPG
jgi:ABC-type oligopeptide transport system ATPase subunit/NAD(P)-dependent dehydrogenase (short-subunit alcohol dehydrogenase family)